MLEEALFQSDLQQRLIPILHDAFAEKCQPFADRGESLEYYCDLPICSVGCTDVGFLCRNVLPEQLYNTYAKKAKS